MACVTSFPLLWSQCPACCGSPVNLCLTLVPLPCVPQNASEQMNAEEDEIRKKLGKKTIKKGRAKPVALTWDQKLDIARGELEEIKKDAVETERNSVRMIDTLKAGAAHCSMCTVASASGSCSACVLRAAYRHSWSKLTSALQR